MFSYFNVRIQKNITFSTGEKNEKNTSTSSQSSSQLTNAIKTHEFHSRSCSKKIFFYVYLTQKFTITQREEKKNIQKDSFSSSSPFFVIFISRSLLASSSRVSLWFSFYSTAITWCPWNNFQGFILSSTRDDTEKYHLSIVWKTTQLWIFFFEMPFASRHTSVNLQRDDDDGCNGDVKQENDESVVENKTTTLNFINAQPKSHFNYSD